MVIWVEPDPVTWPLVTSIVSTVLLSDVFFIVIFPLSTSTFSLKFKTILDETEISVASSAGVDELKVGVASAVPKYSISLIWCILPLTTEVT